jgi:hypothetical protein
MLHVRGRHKLLPQVLWTMHDDDNWWKGELYGQIGFFPACFIDFVD